MSVTPEFSRPVRIDTLGGAPRRIEVSAEPDERAALARRFALPAIDSLTATADVHVREDEVHAAGRLQAAVTQSCVATGAPLPATLDVPFDLVFRPTPEGGTPDEEIELSEEDMDVIFYDGARIDLGEAAAETLSLALDPFPRAPDAAAALKAAGVKSEGEASPFGALADLKDKLGGG